MCVMGFLFTIKKYMNWTSLMLFMAICFVPMFIIFIRGDYAPLRVFVVSAPFFSLIGSIGIYQFWRHFVNQKRVLDISFLIVILIYSIFCFNQELKKIDNHLLTDITEGKRSQDLYYQYYSYHYQPLRDIGRFKETYDGKIPVIIYGCEPHGVSNYLDKFGIPYYDKRNQSNVLDSLLSLSDSIYLITNHPFSLDTIKRYKPVIINEDLSYHNILLINNE